MSLGMVEMQDETVTTKEAAAILGVSQRHVRRLVEQGRIVGFMVGQFATNGARGSAQWEVSLASVERYKLHQEYWRRVKSYQFTARNRARWDAIRAAERRKWAAEEERERHERYKALYGDDYY